MDPYFSKKPKSFGKETLTKTPVETETLVEEKNPVKFQTKPPFPENSDQKQMDPWEYQGPPSGR
ncbi:MAG: hypothetical protein KAS02_00795 [Candidatus Pacebacteria bacterium]|nr:hypothetical protein [Candidatus Paceibacterota bacterium]